MSTRAARFGRRRRARSLLGVALLAALSLALVVGLVGGCGGGLSGSQEGDGEPRTAAEGGETDATTESAVEGGGETTGGAADGASDPRKPYTAIAPPPDATPLKEAPGPPEPQGASAESTAVDQYGNPISPVTRTVPLGQTLVAGAQDPTDGPLKNNRLVAYYGTPLSELMGVLGESDPETMMAKLKEQAAAYSALDPSRPAIPTIEFIASIAQSEPGTSGLYISQAPGEAVEEYAQLAEKHGALLLLDVQLGLATVSDEVEILRPFLERPYVHLAIDTEYSVEPGQVPGVDLGNVDGAEIAEAVNNLDRLVEENDLPPKILLVHQFESGIVTNKQLIQPTENVEVVLHADGFGGPEAKLTKYDLLVRDEATQYGGFKLFYQQDAPLLSPEQVLQLDPAPAVVTYQ